MLMEFALYSTDNDTGIFEVSEASHCPPEALMREVRVHSWFVRPLIVSQKSTDDIFFFGYNGVWLCYVDTLK